MSQANDKWLATPVLPPDLSIPAGDTCVNVHVIDSTAKLTAPIKHLVQPPIKNHEIHECPSFSFLIRHPSGRNLLFDLGTRKDWTNLPPSVGKLLEQYSFGIQVEKNISEILEEEGFDVAGGAIKSIIWSHWHYDHIGDVSTFPSSTDLVVGPGFKQTFIPGYPKREDGLILESDYEGRTVRELSFDNEGGLKIGGFGAEDYFGDGSFYILNTPGHAVGHVCGLARVTPDTVAGDKSTFVFMGGDACHHGGEFRPSEYLPLPRSIHLPGGIWATEGSCPGEMMLELHHRKSAVLPFYEPADSAVQDRAEAEQTIRNMQAFDASSNVLVIIAHDKTLLDIGMNVFPSNINAWKEEDYARRGRWLFLEDFDTASHCMSVFF